MINILIDSNIFISQEYNVFTGPLRFIKVCSEKGIVQLVTNDIIVREVKKHLRKDLSESVKAIEKKIEKSSRLQVALRSESCKILEQLQEIPNNMELALDSYLSSADVINNACVSLEKILQQYFDTIPPFEDNEKKKAEFPDAIIIESIKHRENNNQLLFIVSADKGWAAAFPKGNSYNVKVLTSLSEMTNEIALELLNTNIIESIQDEIKEQLLTKAQDWLEDYDYSRIAESIEDGDSIECDVINSAIVQNVSLYFNGIDCVDNEEKTATLDFTVEASIEIKYSYIDHSDEVYDREDRVCYNTVYGNATDIITVNVPMTVFVTASVTINENKNSILSVDDVVFDDLDVVEVETIEIEFEDYADYDEPPFAQYDNCQNRSNKVLEKNKESNA